VVNWPIGLLALANPEAVPLLAMRRWSSSLTLSSPVAAPRPVGAWSFLAGLAAILLLAIFAQGPVRALGQALDVPGHFRLLAAAMRRLKSRGRLVAVVLGATVLSWTVGQAIRFNNAQGLTDLSVLSRTRTLGEVAFDQGTLAAVTPLRDVAGMGADLLMLLIGTVAVFKFAADRWSSADPPPPMRISPATITMIWGGMGLYLLYRLGTLVVDSGGLPVGGCLFVEPLVVPALMLLADGVLLAWVVTELLDASRGWKGEGLNLVDALPRVGGSMLACLAVLPARYASTAAWLAIDTLPRGAQVWLAPMVAGWGPTWMQGGALALLGTVGAVAVGDGSVGGTLRGFFALLRAHGGRLVAVAGVAGSAAGALAGAAYLLVLSLPPQPWVLAAADSYAHYATVPIGLLTVAALVELGASLRPAEAELPKPSAAVEEVAIEVE